MEAFGAARPDSIASLLPLLDRLPVLLWTTDSQARLTFLSGACEAGGDLQQNACIADAQSEALRGNCRQLAVEWNGREMEVRVEPIRAADGTVEGVVGVALDVTERVVAETALRLSEQSYRSLVEEAPYGICRVTESGQLLQVNRAAFEMLGYAPECEADLLVRDLPLIFEHPDVFATCQRVLLTDGTLQGLPTVWIAKDGRKIQVRLGGRAIRNRAGEVLYFDFLVENITEKKDLEARLIQAQKMQAIGQLAGGVAHDFNNLLTVIIGQIGVVLDETADPSLINRLEDVKQAADRAAALTRQLLAFSRRQVQQSSVVDVNRLVGDAARMLKRLVRENITFSFTPGHDVGSVRADRHQIEQVLMNLVVNAQDAMRDGGLLTIETARVRGQIEHDGAGSGPFVSITVRDTGHGIDRELQSRIFEPFFTTKKTGEGTGLGLAMVYEVVKQEGGHIELDSQPGKGTTFRIYLPAAKEPEPAWKEKVTQVAPRGKETVLLAEDEAAVRELVQTYLARLGYKVLVACDGVEALEIAGSFPDRIDLLLSDLVLPRMGGRELAQTLAKSLPHLKIIFMSGYAGQAIADQDLDINESTFLPKPFSLQQLASMVREALDSPGRSFTQAGG